MRLHDLPLIDVLTEWEKLDDCGRDMEAVRALCLEDRYYLLVRVCNRYDMLHPWIHARCREVEAAPNGYLDLWAREHYKSTVITYGGAIQEILRDPEITIGIFSHTKPIAKAFATQIKRELESNQTLLAVFPDILWANPQRDAMQWSVETGITVRRQGNPKEATIEAWGLVDGQPTSKHYKLMIYDDVVTRESVGTPEQVTKTTEAWELSDNLGSVGGRKWHVGTRYSYADTYESILKRGSLKPRLHAATRDGTIDGEPVLLSVDEWKRRVRDQGEATVSCQMLQNPLGGKQRMFDVADLQQYEIRPDTLNVYIMCDPARSKKRDSANTAIAVIGFDYAGNKYLLDGFNHKMDLQERWIRFSQMYSKWTRAPGVQFVKAGYEAYGAQADLDYFKEKMAVDGPSFEVHELRWPADGDGSKIDRVQRLGPDLREHKLFLPYPTSADNLTALQVKMGRSGYGYRVAKAIRRKDENDHVYDLSDQLKVQMHYFPFGALKDLVDAVSRIYDMEPTPPAILTNVSMEPEYT